MAGRGIQLAFDIGGGLMGQIFKKRDRVEDQMFVAGIWGNDVFCVLGV